MYSNRGCNVNVATCTYFIVQGEMCVYTCSFLPARQTAMWHNIVRTSSLTHFRKLSFLGVRNCQLSSYMTDYHYRTHQRARKQVISDLMHNPDRFQHIGDREDRSDIPKEAVKAHTSGKYITTHRGCDVMKGPEDLIIYSQLLWYEKPATIFDIGTYSGGTAVWMADVMKSMGQECDMYSMDIDLSFIEDQVKEIKPPNVHFIECDSHKIEEAFPAAALRNYPHPWVLIEDAHANFDGVLRHFHQFMEVGDYFVVDDTSPDVVEVGTGRVNTPYEPWWSLANEKLPAVKRFLNEYSQYYAVDAFYTDFFGYNGTWNWHGYIRRMSP